MPMLETGIGKDAGCLGPGMSRYEPQNWGVNGYHCSSVIKNLWMLGIRLLFGAGSKGWVARTLGKAAIFGHKSTNGLVHGRLCPCDFVEPTHAKVQVLVHFASPQTSFRRIVGH